jgi:hypothetical protein
MQFIYHIIYKIKFAFCLSAHKKFYSKHYEGWDTWCGNKYYCPVCNMGVHDNSQDINQAAMRQLEVKYR